MSVIEAPRSALRALRRARNRLANLLDPPILVLAYHRVADLERDTQELAVHPERFRRQMRRLKIRYDLLRFQDPWPKSARPAAIVTFDDGYADNATVALPILEEEQVPATFFVSVGAVRQRREFWWDELERLLLSGPAPPEGRLTRYRDLHQQMRGLAPEKREQLLASLRGQFGGDATARPTHRPLTPDEVARLGQSRWASVGAHGVTHTPFSALSLHAQREEMEASRDSLRAWSGADVTAFSFPFGGRRDFTAASVRLAREAGFRRIAANIPGQARRRPDPFVVPRFLVRDWDEDRFAAELKRFETA